MLDGDRSGGLGFVRVLLALKLVRAYRVQGKYAEAEPLIERSLAIREKPLGPEHPHVATTLANYAAMLRKTGRSAEATRMEARAKVIRAKHAERNPAK